MLAMTTGRYTSRKVSERHCQGERFGDEGPPIKCEDTPVFELMNSSGSALHICEYHIEFYWNAWLPFRNAVRDIWPVEKANLR